MVYSRFMDNEDGHTWTGLDDSLELLDWMSNLELAREASVEAEKHSRGVFRCTNDHDQQFCFAPFVLESVGAILDLYEKTGDLHEKNRYILSYYLAMSSMRMIYSTDVSSAV